MDFDKIVAKYPGELYQAHLGLLFFVFFHSFFFFFCSYYIGTLDILLPNKKDTFIYLSVCLFICFL